MKGGVELALPGALRSELVSHARTAAPREAVGVLGGRPDGRVCRLLRLTNRAPGETFWADPYDQYRAFQLLAAAQLTLLAIYHSHPHGPARLSRADVELARVWGCAHLVVGLEPPDGEGVELRAYRVLDGEVHEVALVDPP